MDKAREDIDENNSLALAGKRQMDLMDARVAHAEQDIENLKAMEPMTTPGGDFDGEGFMVRVNDRINKIREEFVGIVRD